MELSLKISLSLFYDAVYRLNMVPALMRMYSEFAVFQNTALRDLSLSIQQLEKARTEYRAALLWMKDVSEKLENPDYRNQLARFREVGTVFIAFPRLIVLASPC